MLATGGLAACLALVAVGPYPVAMVNVPGAPLHNASPPSLALLALGAAQCGIVLLAAPWLGRLAARRSVWTAVVAVNATAMSRYLWHLVPVLVVGPALVLTGVLPAAEPGSAAWFATRPVWVAALVAVLVVVVAAVRGLERPRAAAGPAGRRCAERPRPGSLPLALTGLAGVSAGLVQLTVVAGRATVPAVLGGRVPGGPAVAVTSTWWLAAAGLVQEGQLLRERPQTGFITPRRTARPRSSPGWPGWPGWWP